MHGHTCATERSFSPAPARPGSSFSGRSPTTLSGEAHWVARRNVCIARGTQHARLDSFKERKHLLSQLGACVPFAATDCMYLAHAGPTASPLRPPRLPRLARPTARKFLPSSRAARCECHGHARHMLVTGAQILAVAATMRHVFGVSETDIPCILLCHALRSIFNNDVKL